MASISSFYYKNAQEVFDIIEDQFTLQPDLLVELTKAFLDEVKIGLTNYNQAMAMMYAFISSRRCYPWLVYSPTFVTGVPNGTETGCVTNISPSRVFAHQLILALSLHSI